MTLKLPRAKDPDQARHNQILEAEDVRNLKRGADLFAPSLTLAPGAGALPGLVITQTFSGASLPTGNAANLILIRRDAAQAGAAFVNGFEVSYQYGDPVATGGRQGIASFFNLRAPTSASNPNRNYVALYGNAFSAAGDGGTNTGAGAQGALFPFATWGDLQSGATNMLGIGNEMDISVRTGASVKHKTNLALIEHALDGVSGATTDALLAFSAQTGAIGMDTLVTISDFGTQHPLKSTGTIMATRSIGAGATIAKGIDFTSGVTFTGPAFSSPGFAIDPSGNITAANLTAAWTAYTPVITAGAGAFTTVSAVGSYRQVGKTVHFQAEVTITTNGTAASSIVITLPATAAAKRFSFPARIVGGVQCFGNINGAATPTIVTALKYDNTYPGADGVTVFVSGTYEAA